MILDNLKERIRSKGMRTAFTEGADSRIQQAARALKDEGIVEPVLLGNRAAILQAARENEIAADDLQIIDPDEFEDMEAMIQRALQLRRGRLEAAAAADLLRSTNYFGTMLVEMGYVDGCLGGATYSTADTVRPALQLIKTAPGQSLVSSCFLMVKGEHRYIMADCSINLNPNASDLVEIALQTARTARSLGVEPKMAMLSYSTLGSATGECVAKVAEATARLKRMPIDFEVDGEMQFDCALVPEVAALKAPGSPVAGHANTFIFPNLSAGNIGYKIAARLGGYKAVGPVLQGLRKPINDLSRGCRPDEIYLMSIVTAAQAASQF